ncbi:MAG: phosphotransferase [Candidatus Cloacimonetes bacterium]|nr:phosphotransferase [Candidatus Cloacimonadota bacterium]
MKAEIIINKEKGQVIKICRSHAEFNKELFIYEKKPSFAPRLLEHNQKNTLMLEYVEGIPLTDLIQPDFARLALLFVELHELDRKEDKCVCLMDSNPHNFLFCEKEVKYYIVDFSEWDYDYPEADLIHFLLFWASQYQGEKFHRIFREFLHHYRIHLAVNPIQWELLVPEMILRFDSRRHEYHKLEKVVNPDVQLNRSFLTEL